MGFCLFLIIMWVINEYALFFLINALILRIWGLKFRGSELASSGLTV